MVIDKLIGQETPEGDGVVVTRLFPTHQIMNHDPFVLFDHFTLKEGTGFPNHPHRGFEAITYIFEGGMNHKDNLGNDKFVSQGGAQVFCSGSGLIHSEMPAKKGTTSGIQLWINLAKKEKGISPTYQFFEKEDLPSYSENGIEVTDIVGSNSPVFLNTETTYQHLKFGKDSQKKIIVQRNSNAIVYIVSGEFEINKQKTLAGESLLISTQEESLLNVISYNEGSLVICSGTPHREPIYQHGPYVD
jgi:redox-sensitive bicupin YhaK (pirin superfamily)